MIEKDKLKPWPRATFDSMQDETLESKEEVFVYLDGTLIGGALYADQERGIVLGFVAETRKKPDEDRGWLYSATYPGSHIDSEGYRIAWEDMVGKELDKTHNLYTMKRGKVEILYQDIPEEEWLKWQHKAEEDDCG